MLFSFLPPRTSTHTHTHTHSWGVNILDGIALITVHSLDVAKDTDESYTHSYYDWLYSYWYIYTVWLLEVRIQHSAQLKDS